MSQTQTLIAALWLKNRPKILTHLDLLDRAAETVPLPEAQREEAAATAHKLAGALGMYGFPAATEPARQLEGELTQPTPNPTTLKHLTNQIRASLTTN